MKKMRRGVALLLSVLLVGTPAGTVRADEATGAADVNGQIEIQENKVSEDEAQANEAQAIRMQAAVGENAPVSTLTFGGKTVVQNGKVVTSSGIGWNYDSSTNTLHITEDVTIEANNIEKLIRSTGDLHITVESGVTLTVKNTYSSNDRVAIYAAGDITLDGEGTIDITHDADGRGIKAEKGITIQGITLKISTNGNAQEIRANGGELVIKDAIVTVNGCCMAGNGSGVYQPVCILGKSVVNISSTSEGTEGGLRGSEFEFSDQAHVKVQTINGTLIGPAGNKDFKFVGEQTTDYYFRAQAGASFVKGNAERTINDPYTYFEYIGANHVDKTTITPNAGQATHTMQCQCEGEGKTAITAGCSGGTATCTTQAKCEVCGQSYGDTVPHQYNKYHVCEVCKGLEANADVVVAVVAGSEKRGYTSGEMTAAIDFAGKYPGAVLAIIDPKRDCLDRLEVNNPDADFTIDLAGTNNKFNGIVTVSGGKVTIRDSKTGGTFYHITTQGTGTVTLESGTIKSGAEVTNGTFNVEGGTIPNINLTDGQLNWNSSTAEGTNINYRGQGKVTINAVPQSPLSISLPITQDLSQPVAVLGNGVSLTENMLAIKMGNSYMTPYTLKPVAQGNQIYACLSLSQLDAEDIVLKQVSGFTYDGTKQKPSVTVQRYVKPDSYGTGMDKGDLTEGTDYAVTYKDNVNAGTATVTITGIGCYTDSVVRTFTIAKAAPKQSVVDADSRTYSCRVDNADRVDLTAYLPKDHGGITAATADGTLTYSSAPSVADGVLSYTIKSGEAASGVINVTVSTTNYTDITIRIPVKTKDIGILKLKAGSAVTLQNAVLTEGEKLSVLKFNDAVFVDEAGKEVPGTLAFRTPDAAPAVGTAEVEWVFQPNNGKTYMEIAGMVSVMVKAKETSGGSSSGGTSSGGGIGGGGAAVTDPKDDTKKDDTKKDDSKKDNNKKDDTKQTAATPKPSGTKLKDSSGVSYEVTSARKKAPAVAYTAAPKKAKKTVTIPKTVTVDGTKYKVTSIAENAFAKNKNVKQIIVSQNITTIGANAFADCPKLKTITINSVKLTGKNVADDAFAGIADGTVIRVPKKMLARYQKLFAKKGLSKKVKVVAIKNKNRKNK